VTRRADLARLALSRVLLTRRAFGHIYFDMRHLPELVDSQLSALAPLLGLAEDELGAGHGARRSQ
jgi:hypothetical protein